MLTDSKCQERKCKHFIGVFQPTGREPIEYYICEAFQEDSGGIPYDIAWGANLHSKPFPGQTNKIVYEKE